MPPRPPPRRAARKPERRPPAGRARPRRAALALGVAAVVAAVLGWSILGRDRPRRLREAAEAATRSGDRPAALAAWRRANRAEAPTARGLLAEARAALALDRGAEARLALGRASAVDPADAEVWRARLDLLRVLDRPAEALRLGEVALRSAPPEGRRALLASLTLAALAEPPDAEARGLLDRWIAADPGDVDARVARLARIAAGQHPGDPDRASRIAELAAILGREPGHVAAREALVTALADAGEPDRGRAALDAWPEAGRDARYHRLRGRWDLNYDRRPDRAAESYRRALAEVPHDGMAHYGLARALRATGRDAEARAEAEAVARLRERLEPSALGARLAADLGRPDDPRARLDLAELCDGVGLAALAEAWRGEARRPPGR